MGSDGMIVCSSWAGPPEPTGWDGHLLKKKKVGLGRMPRKTVVRQNPWVFAGQNFPRQKAGAAAAPTAGLPAAHPEPRPPPQLSG